MTIRRSLTRFVNGGVPPASPVAPPASTPDEPNDDALPARFDDGAGIIARYARRRYVAAPAIAAEPMPPVVEIGRGTDEHDSAIAAARSRGHVTGLETGRRRSHHAAEDSIRQRLIAAALVSLLFVAAFPGVASAQQRYRVQPGDTLESVAAEFDVEPEAILRSSWLANPPDLTPGDVIVIPDVGQTPADAAHDAAQNEGLSPWTSGVYLVKEGDTVETISATFGVATSDLLSLNGIAEDDYIYPGQRLLIPGSPESTDSAGNLPYPYAQVWVPTHRQEHNLSCEYASAYIATSAFGYGVPESVFIDAIPVTKNPHDGYRGDIDGGWGGYTDYGIYAEPLVAVLNAQGYNADVFYSEGDPTELMAQLDAGHPVLVWLALWGDTGKVFHNDGRYTVFAGDHVMTAYGYDDDYVYLSDPASGTYRALDWETFRWMWGTIDGMSLAIYPA